MSSSFIVVMPKNINLRLVTSGEGTGLVVRASASGSGPGFDPRPSRCVVSLSKRH